MATPPPGTPLDMASTRGARDADLRPGDPGYDEARAVWNGRFDSRPALICRARTSADVADALERARAAGLPVTVKSGGHDYAGHSACAGGLLIDLSPLDSIAVDPQARRWRKGFRHSQRD